MQWKTDEYLSLIFFFSCLTFTDNGFGLSTSIVGKIQNKNLQILMITKKKNKF